MLNINNFLKFQIFWNNSKDRDPKIGDQKSYMGYELSKRVFYYEFYIFRISDPYKGLHVTDYWNEITSTSFQLIRIRDRAL